MKKANVWFITGASRGLGLSLARRLLSKGYRVAATSRSAAELSRELGPASSTFLPLEVDLLDEAAVAAAVRKTREHFDGLDVVVNNAGYGQMGSVEEVSDAEARKNFDVNVFGLLNVTRAALPALRARGNGHVFNIASIGGFVGGFTGFGVYCATKFAVAGVSEGLHADLAPLGIKVTLVYPGYFRTSFLASGSIARPAHPIAAYAGARASEAQHLEQINENQPGDPDKAADALIATYEMAAPPLHLFLGSDAVGMAEAKVAELQRAIADHRALGVSTDF